MRFSLRHETLVLPLRDPFVIARSSEGEGRTSTTMIVELRIAGEDGLVGIGEGYPDPYYGETPETMAVVMPRLLASVDDLPGGPESRRRRSAAPGRPPAPRWPPGRADAAGPSATSPTRAGGRGRPRT